MSGTKEGGLKAAKTNMERFGEDFYSKIGRLGGQSGHTGGFAADPKKARHAGAKGGRNSARGVPRLLRVGWKTYQFSSLKESVEFAKTKYGARAPKFINGGVEMTLPSGDMIRITKHPDYI